MITSSLKTIPIKVKRLLPVLLLISLGFNFIFMFKHTDSFQVRLENNLIKIGNLITPPATTSSNIKSSNSARSESLSANYRANNKPIVYYLHSTSVNTISEEDTYSQAHDLPTSLVIIPGDYRFHGKVYHLEKEGLYRLVFPENDNQQRLVYMDNLEALMSGISWIVTHGNIDNAKTNAEKTEKATGGALTLTCSYVSGWAHYLLSMVHIKSRVVTSFTLDPWNSYDNKHTLIEVFNENLNKWVVYDLTNNAYFLHGNIPLSYLELSEYISNDDYEIIKIANDPIVNINEFMDHGFDYYFTLAKDLNDESTLRQWYKRVMQVPTIASGRYLYYYNENAKTKVDLTTSNYQYITKEEFIDRFYR